MFRQVTRSPLTPQDKMVAFLPHTLVQDDIRDLTALALPSGPHAKRRVPYAIGAYWYNTNGRTRVGYGVVSLSIHVEHLPANPTYLSYQDLLDLPGDAGSMGFHSAYKIGNLLRNHEDNALIERLDLTEDVFDRDALPGLLTNPAALPLGADGWYTARRRG